jgi:hypothetical protein
MFTNANQENISESRRPPIPRNNSKKQKGKKTGKEGAVEVVSIMSATPYLRAPLPTSRLSKCNKCANGLENRSSPWTECDQNNLAVQLRSTGLKQIQILGVLMDCINVNSCGPTVMSFNDASNINMEGWERCSACRRMSKREVAYKNITPILEEPGAE